MVSAIYFCIQNLYFQEGSGDAKPKLAHCVALKKDQKDTDVILSEILPPRVWEADGKMWRQKVTK